MTTELCPLSERISGILNFVAVLSSQIRVSVLQLDVLITVTQLPLHTGIAAVVLLVLFHRALASILILRFLHRGVSRPTIALGEAQRDPKGWQPLGKKSHENQLRIAAGVLERFNSIFGCAGKTFDETFDDRTDLFSFGVSLYETASGRLSFDRDTEAATYGAILYDRRSCPASGTRS